MAIINKYIHIGKIILCLGGVILISIVFFFLFGVEDFSIAQRENAHKFGASYMTMNNPFYSVVNDEIRAVVEANGDYLITRDPELNAKRQSEQIYDLISEGVEAIFVAPVDYEAILPAIQKAREKGIKIINVDTGFYDQDLVDCSVISDNYEAGVQCANYLMEQKKEANIVLLEHSTTKSGVDRMNGFIDTLEKYPKYKIVAREQCKGQLEYAMPAMQKVIEKGIEFDTVFTLNDPSALGAMAALEENEMLKQVDVIGVDGAPEAKSMIKEKIMLATSAQFPTKIGQIAVEQLYYMLEGKEYEKNVIVPVVLITKDNVMEYGVDGWQ
ncbi:MAG: sugar ABC transporter substrate-binding protein [Lachnospiraceae bacterium]